MKMSPTGVITQSANFLSSLANADPSVVQKMIDLVEGLEKDGQTDKQSVIQSAVDTENVQRTKDLHHAQTRSELSDANQAFAAATGKVNQLTSEEKTKLAILRSATDKRDASQKAANDAEAFMTATTKRVADEKKAFDKVLDLLDSVVVPKDLLTVGRNLLSADAADPDAISAVTAKIKNLIDVAEKEASDSIEANNKAQAQLSADLSAYNIASDAHIAVSGALEEATKDLVQKKTTRDNAIIAESNASAAAAKATRERDDAVQFRDAEVTRIDKEAAALAEAKKLLRTLL